MLRGLLLELVSVLENVAREENEFGGWRPAMNRGKTLFCSPFLFLSVLSDLSLQSRSHGPCSFALSSVFENGGSFNFCFRGTIWRSLMRRGLEYFGIPRWSVAPINANRWFLFLVENDISGDVCVLHQYALYNQPA